MSRKTQKVALALIHGIGKQEPDFWIPPAEKIVRLFANELGSVVEEPEKQLVIKPAYWAPALQRKEDLLRLRLQKGGPMDYEKLRNFMLDFAADAIAYQPGRDKIQTYAEIHRLYAQTLSYLALEAGEDAPLTIVSHSLGTVITSNYIYDLQTSGEKDLVPLSVRTVMGESALERGETLTNLYTLGSPIALWSLRYENFGVPITVPGPQAKTRGGWFNIYDRDDVIGYPLKTLNEQYASAITEDIEVNVGGLLTSWNPTSHSHYLEDTAVLTHIATSLATTWRQVNTP